MSLDGQPVYLGLAAVLHADATTDATPFLIGGWFRTRWPMMCTGGGITLGSPPPELFRSPCGTEIGGDSPWGPNGFPGPQGQIAWNGHSLPDGVGPSVIRVHTHDPLAAQCSAEAKAGCEAMLVVDEVLWTGDAWTAASPISVPEAVARLDALSIQEELHLTQGAILNIITVQRHVFPTVRQQPCPAPWPYEVFDLHGDPRFALLAVFPDEAARVAAQKGLPSSADACPTDPRVVRPGAPRWVGQQNVLVLVYGSDAADATQQALSTPSTPIASARLAFPATTVDESYRVLLDFLAGRRSGNLENYPAAAPAVQPQLGNGSDPAASLYGGYVGDAKRRYQADALSFSIGPARTPVKAEVGTWAWKLLVTDAVPGTARVFEVDHPGSTDPALRHEVYVAYEVKQPTVDSWQLLLVDAARWPTPAS